MIFMSLVDNIALLLAASLLHGFWIGRIDRSKWQAQWVSGGIFGVAALVAMSRPLVLSPGVVFDGRSIVISLAGMFGGPLVAGITAVLAILHRLHAGGGGALTGVLVIISSALIGAGFYYWRQRRPALNGMASLLGFGLLVHVNMLVWMLFLPRGAVLSSYKAVAIPIMTLYPLATLLLGMLLVNLEQRAVSDKALLESQERLRLLINQSGAVLWSVDCDLKCTYTVGETLTQLGMPPDVMLGESLYAFSQTEDPNFPPLVAHRAALAGQSATYEHDWNGGHYCVHLEPHCDLSGCITEVIGAAFDVTDYKQAQEQLADSEARLHELAHHMSQVREDEKKHLARELHDHLGQELTMIKLSVNEMESQLRGKQDDLCEKAGSVAQMIDQAIDMVRQTSIDLRPASLDYCGLETVIQDEARKAERIGGLVVQVDCDFSAEELSEELTIDLYRLIQESLTNVIRHAKATEVSLVLKRAGDMIYLTISDDGVGISEMEASRLGSPGLLGMRERVHAHCGTFSIGSEKQGTRVAVGIPLKR